MSRDMPAAERVSVTLEGTADIIRLRVKDSGIGFRAGSPGITVGLGLLSMEERVGMLGGNLRIRSQPGQGTEVIVAVPLEAPMIRRSTHPAGRRPCAHPGRNPGSAGWVLRHRGTGTTTAGRWWSAALRLRPDLIILDISMPLLNGIDAARQIKKAWPEAKLLFLTMHASPVYLREAMDAGGMGYVLKSSANRRTAQPRSRRSLKGRSTSLLHSIGMFWKPCNRPMRGQPHVLPPP